jgi:hypothetical protein
MRRVNAIPRLKIKLASREVLLIRSRLVKYATTLALSVIIAGFRRPAAAVDYEIDFGLVSDLEELRPLVDLSADIGELEQYRSLLERTPDLESRRRLLERIGTAEFRGCPRVPVSDGFTTN